MDQDLQTSLLSAWRTNNRVTMEFVRSLPLRLWNLPLPGESRRTIRAVAAHIHNVRCSWVKTLGREHGVTIPTHIDYRTVTRQQVAAALKKSSIGIESLLQLGFATGSVPPSKGYVWRNLSLDVSHVLTYFVAHEAHHRGQIVMIARQTGYRLPIEVSGGLWQWK